MLKFIIIIIIIIIFIIIIIIIITAYIFYKDCQIAEQLS